MMRFRKSPKLEGAITTKPYPEQQMFILALCRICEPIAFMSIFPYIYYMIASFKITSNDRQIAIYAGMVTSAFAFAEFLTGVFWGRLSDKIGRKPVLLTGLAGTGLSMLIFGFAKTLPHALLARALGGILNGNIGVLQTTVAEMITEKEHQRGFLPGVIALLARAYALMPFIWCLGSILGPALGGALAEPCLSYPGIFARGTIFDIFPYLLPNLICALVVICGVIVGVLFLEETHEEKRHRRDVGLEAGRWIVQQMSRIKYVIDFGQISPHRRGTKSSDEDFEERRSLMSELDQPPGYRSTEGSPGPPKSQSRVCSVDAVAAANAAQSLIPSSREGSRSPRVRRQKQKPGVGRAFTKQVVLLIIGYGLLAYHTIAFEQLMPIVLSTPESTVTPSLPFKFVGGFALSTRTIGFIMSGQGVYSMAAQLFLFPYLVKQYGPLRLFRSVITVWPVLYLLVPYMVLLSKAHRIVALAIVLTAKVSFQVCSYPSFQIMLTNSASSTLVLGGLNGVAASTASLARAFGPTVSGLLHTVGLDLGYSGLAWWIAGGISLIGAIECLWLRDVNVRYEKSSLVSGSKDQDAPEMETDLETCNDLLSVSVNDRNGHVVRATVKS